MIDFNRPSTRRWRFYHTVQILMLTLFVSQAFCSEDFVKVKKIVSVYDADTFRVDIVGWPDIVGKNMPIRLKGVDAPEIRGKCRKEMLLAKQARDYTAKFLKSAQIVVLSDIERGKYFRVVASVRADGVDLATALIKRGFARSYNGGKRESWCEDS